ncbi:MAG: hypothetical protein QOF36_2000 [Microbacteriaceae bacterium]|nr:hypothetical protein [Microbacteriaceae bacterium]
MKRTAPFRIGRASVIAATLTAGALLLSGCAASATATPSSAPTSASGKSAPSGQSTAGRGVSGQIAAVSDGTLQVQGGTTQTAVTYTSSTTITQAVSAAASAVTVGSCVVGITTPNAAAATTVAISPAVNGACAARGGGFGGGGGARPSGAPGGGGGARPTGAPGGGGFTRPVSGLVTAVTSTDITVSTTSQSGSASTGTIKLDGSTTYTTEQPATAAALVVNKCVAATGTADNSGNFAATALAITDPGANGCGLGGRPGGTNG